MKINLSIILFIPALTSIKQIVLFSASKNKQYSLAGSTQTFLQSNFISLSLIVGLLLTFSHA